MYAKINILLNFNVHVKCLLYICQFKRKLLIYFGYFVILLVELVISLYTCTASRYCTAMNEDIVLPNDITTLCLVPKVPDEFYMDDTV